MRRLDITHFLDNIENRKPFELEERDVKALCRLFKVYRSAIVSISELDKSELLSAENYAYRALEREKSFLKRHYSNKNIM